MLDEREKRKAAEARAARYEEQERARAQAAQAAQRTPDQQREAQRYQDNMRISRRFAERDLGKEQFETLHAWAVAKCDADPAFNREMYTSEDPYDAAHKAYQREQVLAKVSPGDLAEFDAWKASRADPAAQLASTPAAAGAAQPSPPPPPRSLVAAPNAGGAGRPEIAVGPGSAHATLFSRPPR